MTIKISTRFSETPGARYRTDGDFSGEEFRESILIPEFEKAIEKKEKLIIDLDGGYGYPTSFLEESFGGLARIYGADKVNRCLEFVTDDEPSLEKEIRSYILASKKEGKKQ